MRQSGGYLIQVIMALCFLSLLPTVPSKVLAEETHYEGTYTAAPNGDVSVINKFTAPMAVYDLLRKSTSNLYLLMRGLSSTRAEVEVVDRKADWDDSARTLTFSYKTLGMGRNLGNRWEIDVLPGVEFSNLNEGTRMLYFNEDAVTGLLGRVHGVSRLILPAKARDIRWDESRRVVSYAMPVPKTSSGRSPVLWIAGLVLLVIGVLLTAASFLRSSVPVPGEDNLQKLIKHDEE
jgi:hypothetical protein